MAKTKSTKANEVNTSTDTNIKEVIEKEVNNTKEKTVEPAKTTAKKKSSKADDVASTKTKTSKTKTKVEKPANTTDVKNTNVSVESNNTSKADDVASTKTKTSKTKVEEPADTSEKEKWENLYNIISSADNDADEDEEHVYGFDGSKFTEESAYNTAVKLADEGDDKEEGKMKSKKKKNNKKKGNPEKANSQTKKNKTAAAAIRKKLKNKKRVKMGFFARVREWWRKRKEARLLKKSTQKTKFSLWDRIKMAFSGIFSKKSLKLDVDAVQA